MSQRFETLASPEKIETPEVHTLGVDFHIEGIAVPKAIENAYSALGETGRESVHDSIETALKELEKKIAGIDQETTHNMQEYTLHG